ncbi:MAG: hypothetical protein O3B24_01080 [Verrucomicrobia bacterium]|nr:hypothetical protein [Verrucomicrobiota bacterium]
MNVLIAIVRTVAMWGLLWLVFTGVGLLIRRLCGATAATSNDLRLAPWLGWGSAIAFLQFWSFLWPVSAAAFGVVALAGLLGIVAHARVLAGLLAAHRREAMALAALCALCSVWLANHAVMQPGVYDSGLYHLNGVRWASEYAIVPGLGNLHGRLAFNNSSFLYAAMLNLGPFAQRAHHVASGFLILLLLTQGLWAAWLVLRRGGTATTPHFYDALCVAPLIAWAVNSGYTSSLSPDVPCFVLALLLGGELLRLLASPRAPERRLEPFAAIALLAMVGITVKLSFAAYGVAAGVLAFLVQARRLPALRQRVALLAVGAALALVIMVPWCARGILLSGYPAYPSTIGRCPVDWAVSAHSAQIMVERIQSWARIPDVPPESVLNTWSWLGPWFQRTLRDNAFDFTAPLATAWAALMLLVIVRIMLRTRGPSSRWLWLAVLPAIAGDVFWFFAAPDPRYQGSIFWVLGLGLLAIALPPSPRARRWALGIHGALVLALFVRPLDAVRTWKDPGPAQQVPMRTMVTDSGLPVYVPASGDQAWDSALPATPYFNRRLRLRVPDDMARGFTRRAPSAAAAAPDEEQE